VVVVRAEWEEVYERHTTNTREFTLQTKVKSTKLKILYHLEDYKRSVSISCAAQLTCSHFGSTDDKEQRRHFVVE
jgi:hypothetical protein